MNGFFTFMAKIKTEGLAEHIASFQKLGHRLDGCIKAAVFDGARDLADSIRASGKSNSVPDKILDTLYIDTITKKGGSIGTEIGFAGYITNRNGQEVPAALIAGSFESGTSNRNYPKTGFIRKGVKQAEERALSDMEATFNDRVSKIMEE